VAAWSKRQDAKNAKAEINRRSTAPPAVLAIHVADRKAAQRNDD
jgi:hypothetical protein